MVFRLSSTCIPSALNLKPSLLDCKAELLVSGYWCPTRISLVRDLVSGFPFICLPFYLKGFVVSPYLPSLVSLSLLVSQPLWTASGVRLSRCLSSLKWLHLFPAMTGGLSILGGVVWLSECLSSRVFLHVSPILASGSAVRMSPLCFDLAAIIFPYHLSSDSSVSQLMCLHQSALQW